MSKKDKTYKIKVPVYSSELLEDFKGFFEGHSYDHMIEYLDRKLEDYSLHKPRLSRKKRNKIKEVEVQNIEKFERIIGEVPARLFKITAYNTNLIDGYVETQEKINLTRKDKVGSETNFMLIYPTILALILVNISINGKFYFMKILLKKTTNLYLYANLCLTKYLISKSPILN
jgi:hypothetical protein